MLGSEQDTVRHIGLSKHQFSAKRRTERKEDAASNSYLGSYQLVRDIISLTSIQGTDKTCRQVSSHLY